MSLFNQIAMAILLALVVVKGADLIAHIAINPKMLEKNVYVVEGLEAVAVQSDQTEDVLEPIEPLLANASIENGMTLARRCVQCHSFEKGGPTKTGPNLYDIVNNNIAHIEGYAYSRVLADMHDKKWTYEKLNAFLYRPRAFANGTKMAFAGLSKAQDRADMIAYMRTLSDSPAPLPN